MFYHWDILPYKRIIILDSKIARGLHLVSPAYSAPQAELGPIWAMVSSGRAFLLSLALGQFFFGEPGNILPSELLFVAAIAEVRVSPAEPLGH